MKFAAIGPIAVHLPEKVEDNDPSGAVPQVGHAPDFRQDGDSPASYRRPGRVCVGPGRGGRRKALCRTQHRPQLDRFPPVLHANARLRVAHHGLPDAGPLGVAHVDRGVGFQPGLLGVCLWAVAGRRADSCRDRPPRVADHRGNLFEVHRSDRPLAADDFRRRRGRHVGRAVGRAVVGVVRLRHGRPRGRYAAGNRGRRPAKGQAIQPRKRKRWPSACTWTAPSWSSSAWT